MMDSEDGTVRWSWLGRSEDEHSVSQSSERGLDRNVLTIPPKETVFYAFLDSVEHEVAGVTGDVFSLRNNFDMKKVDEGTDLLVARFDCVRADYLNAGVTNVFGPFYAQARGENINSPHDLDKEYWHNPTQATYHRDLVQTFLNNTKNFVVLYLTVLASKGNELLFDRLFASEGWLGLGVIPKRGLRGAPVVAYDQADHELKSPQGPWTMTTVYDLKPKRLNNLRHVFSVDFAPDAVMPPGGLPPPPRVRMPVPVGGKGGHHVAKQAKAQRKVQLKKRMLGVEGRLKNDDRITFIVPQGSSVVVVTMSMRELKRARTGKTTATKVLLVKARRFPIKNF